MGERTWLVDPMPSEHGDVARIEALRRAGALTAARHAVEAALVEDPYHPGLQDLLARVLCDAGDAQGARDAWNAVRTLVPGHVGALKGLGFLAFRRGDRGAARRFLTDALSKDPRDTGARAALERLSDRAQGLASRVAASSEQLPSAPAATVTAPDPATRRHDSSSTSLVLTCDAEGLLLNSTRSGADASASIACEMSVLAATLARACRHLTLGAWSTCLVERDDVDASVVGRCERGELVLTEAYGEGAAGRALARARTEADSGLLPGGRVP